MMHSWYFKGHVSNTRLMCAARNYKVFRNLFPANVSFRQKVNGWWMEKGNNGLKWINPFHANVLFLYHLKTSENLRFSNIFRRYRNWVNSILLQCVQKCGKVKQCTSHRDEFITWFYLRLLVLGTDLQCSNLQNYWS